MRLILHLPAAPIRLVVCPSLICCTCSVSKAVGLDFHTVVIVHEFIVMSTFYLRVTDTGLE